MAESTSRLSELISRLKGRKGLRPFSRDIKVDPGTLSGWLSGDVETPRGGNRMALVSYLGCADEDLSRYLAGEVELDELLANLPQTDQPLTINKVLSWIPTLSLNELARLAEAATELIRRRTDSHSIADLIEAELKNRRWPIDRLAQEVDISVEALIRLRNGDQPAEEQLLDLTLVLTKSDGSRWTFDELKAISCSHHRQNTTHTNGG
ncbi:hypothetical protein NDA01_24190 [Trichocoleus desertorum AS-A10]|uniref:hypothetical protein n=1 Tax=Trichocoleus desertorum TaxID=1481672 RepID=UPI003297EEDC